MFARKYRKPQIAFWLALLSTFLGLTLFLPACFATDVDVTMFGPKQYLRTTDKVNFYSHSFRGVRGKGTAIIQNGDGNGNNLVKDALILINGIPVFDSSKMNQPGYTLEAPIWMDEKNWILLLLIGEPGSYVTIQVAAEITPDATTTQVIGIAGGTVSVQNHLGDTFTLQIPPLALGGDTSISISSLPRALPSPIAKNLYPGAVLGPSGLIFSLPVKATVILHQPLANPAAMLLSQKNSDFVLPSANQTVLTAQNSIQGEIYHFSPPLVAGAPTEDEIRSMVHLIAGQPDTTLEDLLENVNSLLYLAKLVEYLGYDLSSLDPMKDAKNLLERGAAFFVAAPMPANPCGTYSLEMEWLWHALSTLGVGLESGLDSDVLARTCSFHVSPPTASLGVGQSLQKALTATLRDASGNLRTCSVLNWYSFNEGVVEVAESGDNQATLTGVGQGTADVWASCDGLLAYSTVTIGIVTFAVTGTLMDAARTFTFSFAPGSTVSINTSTGFVAGSNITIQENGDQFTLSNLTVTNPNEIFWANSAAYGSLLIEPLSSFKGFTGGFVKLAEYIPDLNTVYDSSNTTFTPVR